jgi:serine/threonine protein kinase
MAYQQTLPNGTVLIEEFRILGHLGSGGFANTYLATDLTLGREVAIKEYFPSELAIRADTERVEVKSAAHGAQFEWALGRFVREAKTLAKFRHPSVVRVFRVFNANATAYIVLEFVRGSNMEAWIKSLGRPPTQAELDELLPPLLDALEVVHGAGILHRDIKPANIYIRAADHTPVLLDFGAARYAAGDYAGTTAAIVSKGYSPHEAYATDSRLQGPWTDIYGLAATIYRALSGTAPPESTMRVLEDHCVAAVDLELPLSGGYRAGFLEAIDWALEVMPKQRPQSVAEWRYKLLPNTVALPKLRDANGEPTTVQEWNPMSDRQSDATTFDPPMGSMPRPSSAAQPTGTARARGSAARQSAAAASTPAAAASAAHGAARHSVVVGTSTSMARPRSGGSLAASSGASGAPRSAGGGVVDRQSQPVGNRTFVIGLALFAAGGLALLGQWFINRKPSAPAQIAAPTRPVESRDAPIIDRNRIEREAAAEQARKEREAAAAAEQARKEREAAAAAEQARKEREAAAAAEQARKEREAAAAAEQTRKEREAAAAAEQARKEREAAAAEQARKEREAAAAQKARKEREAAAAEQTR